MKSRGGEMVYARALRALERKFMRVRLPPPAHFAVCDLLSVNITMAHFVYIVECADLSFYTGITWNLKKRILEHNNGESIATKGKLPVKLVYWEIHKDRSLAAKREKEIKGWGRIKKLALIETLRQAR